VRKYGNHVSLRIMKRIPKYRTKPQFTDANKSLEKVAKFK